MSDTYSKQIKDAESLPKGSLSRSDDKYHPQQDMGDGYYNKPNLSQFSDPEERAKEGGCEEDCD